MASIRPKTIKDGFKSFFNRFLKRIELDENDDQYLQYRFIEFDKRRDVSFYSKLVIKAKREDYDGKKTFLVTCLRNTYFVTVGYRSVNIPTLVKPEDTPVGLFLAIVLEGDLQIKDNKDNLHIENEIIVPIEDTANPQGYDFDKIIEYFPEVNVYHVLFPSQDYNRLLDKLSIIMYCKNKSLLRLNIPENILLCYIDLINQSYENINYDNLWRSISSNEWRYCFIELYRCLEVLFNISRTFDLSDKTKSKHDLSSLFHFSWKQLRDYYHEDLMIEFLFEQLSQPILNMLKTNTSIKNSKGFYTLRNSIVHGKRNIYNTNGIKKESEWQNIIHFSIKAIDELYNLYDKDLTNFDESIVKNNKK